MEGVTRLRYTATMIIFGYGSLMQTESLKTTVPSAKNLYPVYIKGFRREFTLWDPVGWTETNLDLADIPFCAVDIQPAVDDSLVNGIIFEVDQSEVPALLEREKGYKLIETTAYDFITQEPIEACMVFSANTRTGEYDFESEAQQRYLDVCLEGAKQYGEEFYGMFCNTTYIGDRLIKDIKGLYE